MKLLLFFICVNFLIGFGLMITNWKLARSQIEIVDSSAKVDAYIQSNKKAILNSTNVIELRRNLIETSILEVKNSNSRDEAIKKLANHIIHLQVHFMVILFLVNLGSVYIGLRKGVGS